MNMRTGETNMFSPRTCNMLNNRHRIVQGLITQQQHQATNANDEKEETITRVAQITSKHVSHHHDARSPLLFAGQCTCVQQYCDAAATIDR